MSATPLQRIAMPDKASFFRDYVFKRKPVIITDLFDGQPIREVSSREDAKQMFGSAQLRIQSEAVAAAAAGDNHERCMTLQEYVDFASANPTTDLVCTEYEIPARIMAAFTLPEICYLDDAGENEVLSLPKKYGNHDLLTNVFIANAGNKAHLHYDGDHRQVLLYQVFGRKQVIVFPPESGRFLKPLDCLAGFAGVNLESMSQTEKEELVEQAGGYIGMLMPGDTIYMPMLAWHYLEYVDDAMSFNVRFARNRYGRFLCTDNLHRDYYIQNVGSRLADDRACATTYKPALDGVVDEFVRPTQTRFEKVRRVRQLFKELCGSICPEARADEYCPPEREPQEMEKIMREVEPTVRYADPATLAKLRPVGAINPAQRRHLEAKVAKCGYPSGVLEHLLGNRLGKNSLDQLTQAEAAQFMSFLRSPGSAW